MDSNAASRCILPLTRIFSWATRAGFALFPGIAIAYLYYFGDSSQRFVAHGFHEVAITLATALSGFIALVTWRCYRESGEPFLFWLAQGVTGFTVVYLPHGVLTRFADHNILLFLLYGPASRVVMVLCLFIGLLRYGDAADPLEQRRSTACFWRGMVVFAVVDVLVAIVAGAQQPYAGWFRLLTESGTIMLTLACAVIMLRRRISSPLMNLYLVGMMFFAESSMAFLLATPWDHLWWLAHLVFAGGFFAVSYGIVEAFHTTRAFSTVFSQQEMMRRLEFANAKLARLAATDSLTGVANRRHFFQRAEEELSRAQRSGETFALLMMDIDHFKDINDRYGHAAGDAALVAFCAHARQILRAPDLFGRLGGEEFAVLLPASGLMEAVSVAERIRLLVEQEAVSANGCVVRFTVSIGVAEFGEDGGSIESLIKAADERLYLAKHHGRNCVYAAPRGDMHGALPA